MAKRRRRASLTALVAVLAVGAFMLPAGPASAAAGVKGALTVAHFHNYYSTICTTTPCSTVESSEVTFSGWAYNASTKPVQEVRVRFGYDFVNTQTYVCGGSCTPPSKYFSGVYYTGVQVANKKRSDSHSPYGFSWSEVPIFNYTGKNSYFDPSGRTPKACVEGRDHGTSQAWRTLQCVTLTKV